MSADLQHPSLLPPPPTETELMEQGAAGAVRSSPWVRGSVGERTRLPDAEGGGPALQLRIQLPGAPEVSAELQEEEPPPPPQVLFRAREVIRPPEPHVRPQEESPGPPGSHPLDPVDAPPGLADDFFS